MNERKGTTSERNETKATRTTISLRTLVRVWVDRDGIKFAIGLRLTNLCSSGQLE